MAFIENFSFNFNIKETNFFQSCTEFGSKFTDIFQFPNTKSLHINHEEISNTHENSKELQQPIVGRLSSLSDGERGELAPDSSSVYSEWDPKETQVFHDDIKLRFETNAMRAKSVLVISNPYKTKIVSNPSPNSGCIDTDDEELHSAGTKSTTIFSNDQYNLDSNSEYGDIELSPIVIPKIRKSQEYTKIRSQNESNFSSYRGSSQKLISKEERDQLAADYQYLLDLKEEQFRPKRKLSLYSLTEKEFQDPKTLPPLPPMLLSDPTIPGYMIQKFPNNRLDQLLPKKRPMERLLGDYFPGRFRKTKQIDCEGEEFRHYQRVMFFRLIEHQMRDSKYDVKYRPDRKGLRFRDRIANFEREELILDMINEIYGSNKPYEPKLPGKRWVYRKHIFRRWKNYQRDTNIIKDYIGRELVPRIKRLRKYGASDQLVSKLAWGDENEFRYFLRWEECIMH